MSTGIQVVQLSHKRNKKKINWKRLLFIWGMLAIPLIHFAIFFVYVNIDSVLMSFQKFNVSEMKFVWTFDNYARFWRELTSPTMHSLRNAILNSTLFGLNDILLVLISLVLSYFFFKKIRGRSFFRIIFFLPSIISIVIYTMAYKFMFQQNTGPINQLIKAFGGEPPMWFNEEKLTLLLVMVYCLWVGTGYNILIFGGAMANLNSEVIEYAKLDGVGMFRELFQIILPMIWPTLSVAFLGSVTTVFTLFIQVQLLTLGSSTFSVKTIAYIINTSVDSNPEWAATVGICFTLVAAPIIIGVRKLIDVIGKKFGY